MAKKARTAYGLPVENGRIACRVISRIPGSGMYPGQVYGMLIPELEAEMRRSEPRFRPDIGRPSEADELAQVDGLTPRDQAQLYDRGVYFFTDLVDDKRSEDIKAGITAWLMLDSAADKVRKRKALRHLQERFKQSGLEVAVMYPDVPEPEPSKVDLDQLKTDLARWADPEGPGDMVGEEIAAALEQVSDGDLEELRAALELAYVAIEERKPGNMGLVKQRARILEQIRGTETPA